MSAENQEIVARYVDIIGMDDVPHLCEPYMPRAKREAILGKFDAATRMAREKGIPTAGENQVWAVEEDQLYVDPFPIPDFWLRAAGMDFGWHCTAYIPCAHDPENDVFYVTGEYFSGRKEPALHASGIKAMMPWPLQIAGDPAAEISSQKDGTQLLTDYLDEGLDLIRANNAVYAGNRKVLGLMQAGRLKIFKTCVRLKKEIRLYRTKDGKVVKKNDHGCDGLRYCINTDGLQWRAKPIERKRRRVVPGGEF